MRRFVIALGLVLTAASPALAVEPGDHAPCVILEHINAPDWEGEHCIRDHKETQQFTLIEFFSIRCSDCAQSRPILTALSRRISGSTQVRFVAIDRNEEQVRAFVAREASEFAGLPVALDSSRMATRAYDVLVTPTLFLLDDDNQVVFKHVGTPSPEEIERIISLVGGAE